VLAVFINASNVTVAEAKGVFWGVFVHGHLMAVVTVQTVAGAQPDEATMVLMDGFDGTVGEAIFILDVFEVEFGGAVLGIGIVEQAQQDKPWQADLPGEKVPTPFICYSYHLGLFNRSGPNPKRISKPHQPAAAKRYGIYL